MGKIEKPPCLKSVIRHSVQLFNSIQPKELGEEEIHMPQCKSVKCRTELNRVHVQENSNYWAGEVQPYHALHQQSILMHKGSWSFRFFARLTQFKEQYWGADRNLLQHFRGFHIVYIKPQTWNNSKMFFSPLALKDVLFVPKFRIFFSYCSAVYLVKMQVVVNSANTATHQTFVALWLQGNSPQGSVKG